MKNLVFSTVAALTLILSAVANASTAPQTVPASQLASVKNSAVEALNGHQLDCLVRGYAMNGGGAQLSISKLILSATIARIDNSSLPTSEFITPYQKGQIAVWVVQSQDKKSLNSVLIVESEMTNLALSSGSIQQLTPLTIKICQPL